MCDQRNTWVEKEKCQDNLHILFIFYTADVNYDRVGKLN